MLVGLIYFLVIICANTLGAVVGMGGGIIIKPILDLLAYHSVVETSFYASVSVFVMATVAVLRQANNRTVHLTVKVGLLISIGATVGGFFGQQTFDYLLRMINNEQIFQYISISLMICLLLLAYIYSFFSTFSVQLTYVFAYFVVGLLLGFLASFLGIGGGPVNVAALMICFSMSIKQASVYSLAIVLFSQCTNLIAIGLATAFKPFDLSLLFFIIPAAILGGLLGAKSSQLLSARRILALYRIMLVAVIMLNIYHAVSLF